MPDYSVRVGDVEITALSDGYLEFEQALTGDHLQRLQRAFKQAVTDCKPDWLEGIARGTAPAAHFDIPNPFQRDDVFIDMVDSPALVPVMSRSATHPRNSLVSEPQKLGA